MGAKEMFLTRWVSDGVYWKWDLIKIFRKSPATVALLIVIFGVFVGPLPSNATQIHAAPEGLYSHQIAHLFFLISMGILVYWLRGRGLTRARGWRYLQYSALFFMFWNVDTMIVHNLEGRGDLFQVLYPGTLQARLQIKPGHEFWAWMLYVGKLDHLLCVPAIVFLYWALRELIRTGDHLSVGGEQK